MSLNSHYISSIKEDDEIDPGLIHFPNPENDNIENFQGNFVKIEESSENMNFRAIANINQNEQNETQKELNETQNELNEIQIEQNELILNSNNEETEDKKEEYKETVQIPQEVVKNKIEDIVLLEDIFIIKKNLVVKKLDDSLKSKVEDKLDYLCNNSKEINSLTCKYGEKKISKKKSSSMEFLRRKRNQK